MTQQELADRVGIPQSAVSHMENGQAPLFLERLLALSRETGLTVNKTPSFSVAEPPRMWPEGPVGRAVRMRRGPVAYTTWRSSCRFFSAR
jgi:transcriptional regulator with XRE-family HTH domain